MEDHEWKIPFEVAARSGGWSGPLGRWIVASWLLLGAGWGTAEAGVLFRPQ
jgi:hypothetical protein